MTKKTMKKVKVITLKQPWAYLYAIGAKKNETRSWKTEFRGELFIHASAKINFSDLELCRESPHFKKYIPDPSSGILVQGAIIGKVNLTDIVRTEEILDTISSEEKAFGDYSANRYAWKGEGAVLLPNPIFLKGKLSIWDYEMEDEPEEQEHESEPDMMGPNQHEFAERMSFYQSLK